MTPDGALAHGARLAVKAGSFVPKRPATLTIELRLRDFDRLGHVNQSVYQDLLTEGRQRLFASLRTSERAFVLAHIELSYRREIRPEDERVEVTAYVVKVGEKSITVAQEILLPDGAVAADGRVVLAAWDIAGRCSRTLEPHERERLNSFILDPGQPVRARAGSQPPC